VVFIQVPPESENASATEKQFRSCLELCNKTSRQVHKTSVNIFCSYIQNLLVMQFRCLRVSGALHVMCVEKTIRVMCKWFQTFLTRFNITHLCQFLKKCFRQFFNNQTPIHETSTKIKYVTYCLKLFCCRKTKIIIVDH